MVHSNAMNPPKVAILGTGVIGASWATCFLAHGLDVTASDPAPGAEARLRAQVDQQWASAAALGLAEGASPQRLRFCSDLRDAVEGADFVQENGPERLDVKRVLFAELDAAAPAHAILASSSSGIPASGFQTACRHPERVLIGHPFNPPHLIPLVEVVGGQLTSPEAIARAMAFYTAMGRRPIHIRKELKGFVTNRLQAALWREAYGLVQAGVATVEDIDAAIANGPGLRWALLGPFATQHLSGGPGGLAHVLEHLGPPMDDYWQDLLPTRLTDEVKAAVLAGSDAQTAAWDLGAVTRERDEMLVTLLQLKAARKPFA
jgi:3-hydroxyacyl-CoA dehydrogenase